MSGRKEQSGYCFEWLIIYTNKLGICGFNVKQKWKSLRIVRK